MAGVGELIASAVVKQVVGKLSTAIWDAIATQLKLKEDLRGLHNKLVSIQDGLWKVENRSIKDGEICSWMRRLKDAAYDLEDMLMDFECQTSCKNDNSPGNMPIKVSIPMNLRLTMANNLKAMKARLEEILNDKKFEDVVGTSSDNHDAGMQTQQTSPTIEKDMLLVGRMEERAKMMELLKEDYEHSIIPIHGFGGLGKTTLAQMVFNDSRTKEEFQIRVWVYVSTKLSVEQIGRSIISQVSLQKRDMVIPQIVGHNLEHADLSTLQMLVGMMLSEERCLIVLDDIWGEDTNSLGEVKKLLQARTPGSKIIVTTRIKSVANEMNKFFSIQLGRLPYKHCWELFKAEAFPNETVEHQKEKEVVGQKIVKKCDGVPLAIRALGHRLWNKPLRSWEEMLRSDLWKHEQNQTIETISTPVLPSLKISYFYMHRYLRPCFLYFSAFPKGFTIEKGDLIRRWIALGLVATRDNAEDYLQRFLGMSFLEVASDASPSMFARYTKHQTVFFRMNNMIHDLARLVADDEVIVYDATASKGNYHKERQNCRYKLLLNFSGSSQLRDSMPPTVRAIHFKDCRDVQIDFGSLMQAKFLRVLDLNACTGAYILRGCINGWRLLKFLDISGMQTETLPSFLSSLHGLQTLNLSKCASLQRLPPDFGGLEKLSFLDLSHCDELQELPDSFSSLVNMIDLNMSFCRQLKRLPTGLLENMKELLVLNLSGCTSLDTLPVPDNNCGCRKLEILELSDCSNLAALPIYCTSFHELRCLNLSGCSRIQNFPNLIPQWKFGKLEYLNLSGIGAKAYSKAPATSAGDAGSSEDPNKELELGMLQKDISQHLAHLKYLSFGGFTIFSEQGIASLVDLLTLPNFDVRQQHGDNHSNVMLLQQILDFTHHELNIKCLENVVSPEEAKQLELGRKHQLHFLSLEWSPSDIGSSTEDARRAKASAVLEHLRPHRNLQFLSIKGYGGMTLPSWVKEINHALPNLVKIVLSELHRCQDILTLKYLPKLQELKINSIPLLHEVIIVSCKKLRRLTLVNLLNATVRFYDDNTETQVNEVGFVDEYLAGPPHVNKQVKRKVVAAPLLVKVKGWLKTSCCDMSREIERTQYHVERTDSPAVTSTQPLTPGPSNEKREQSAALPTLDYFKIESCYNLILYPYVPICKEYVIEDSRINNVDHNPEFRFRWRGSPPRLYELGSPSSERGSPPRLYERGSPPQFYERGSPPRLFKRGQRWELYEPEFYEEEFRSGTLGKLTLLGSYSRQLLPLFTSVQELELDGSICIDADLLSTLRQMTKLEKLTIPSVELLEANMIRELSIHHIAYVNTREVALFSARPKRGSVTSCSSNNFSLLHRYLDNEIQQLMLQNLEHMETAEEVSEYSKLSEHQQLQSLSLMWSSSSLPRDSRVVHHDDIAVLEKLKPHKNLETLRIQGYRGDTLCPWVRDISLSLPNLVTVELADLIWCEEFPLLGQLANLEILHISNMPTVRKLGCDIYGAEKPFRKLRKLTLVSMVNLVECTTTLSTCDDEQKLEESHGDGIFPNLQVLAIRNCPRMRFVPAFPGSQRCTIESSSYVLSSEQFIGSSNLTPWTLEIIDCGFCPEDDFKLFEHTVNLEQLTFRYCNSLVSLPDTIRSCCSLRRLAIVGCLNFSALPEWVGELASLQELTVHAGKLDYAHEMGRQSEWLVWFGGNTRTVPCGLVNQSPPVLSSSDSPPQGLDAM